jgi:peptidoglycan/LPS O-acetylase OafA/YrhL
MGLLRLFLALDVFNWHHFRIADGYLPNSFSAVFIFFIISGFYMSLVLNEKYERRAIGTLTFYLSRAGRLYPIYWAATLLVIVLISVHLIRAMGIVPSLDWHNPDLGWTHWGALANQLLIFPHALWANLTLAAPDTRADLQFAQAYTVALEMMFYAIAPVLVRRGTLTLAVLTAVALAAHLAPYFFGLDPRGWQYEFFPSTLVFFLMGTLSYKLYVALRPRPWRVAPAICVEALIAYAHISGNGLRWIYTDNVEPFALYIAIALAIPFLFAASKKSRLDRLLGDFSYPIYIIYPIAMYVVVDQAGAGTTMQKWEVAAVAAVIVLVAVFVIERPIDRVREAWARRTAARLIGLFSQRWIEQRAGGIDHIGIENLPHPLP